jgi:hypothetical protein
MARPVIIANGGTPGVKASVAATSLVTLTLDSIVGVRNVQWIVLSTDETTGTEDYTLTQSGSVGQTATFTSLVEGTAVLIKVIVNNGIVRDLPDPVATSNTIKVYVPTVDGFEVGATGETLESNSTHGSTGIINAPIRSLAAFTTSLYESDVKRAKASAIANVALTGDPSPMDGQTIVTGDIVFLSNQTAPAENGLWEVSTTGAWSRPDNFTTQDAILGCVIAVILGTARAGYFYQNTNAAAITVGTTALTFLRLPDRFDREDLSDASSTPLANKLVRYNGTLGLTADYFQSDAASVPSAGVIRSGDGEVILASRDDADTTDVNLVSWGVSAVDHLDIGNTFVDAINMSVKATKNFHWLDDGTIFGTLTKAGGFVLTDLSGFTGAYFSSNALIPATTGLIRAATRTDALVFRNDNNTGDVRAVWMDSSGVNDLVYGDTTANSVTVKVDATTGQIRLDNNTAFFAAGSFGTGVDVIFIANAATPPTTNPTGGVILYVEGGVLKSRDPNGLTTLIAPNWKQTALKTADYTAAAFEHVLVDMDAAAADVTITLPASTAATKDFRVRISDVSVGGGVAVGFAMKVSGTMATTFDAPYSTSPYIVANNGGGQSRVGAWIEMLDTGAGWLPVGIGCVPT